MIVGACCFTLSSCREESVGPEPIELPPPVSLADLFGPTLVDADGNQVAVETIEGTPLVGILYAAGWCSHCEEFIPHLIGTYDSLALAGKPFKVVFVSFDNTATDMAEHMSDTGMPWLAIPFGSSFISALQLRYDVTSIPTLIVVDSDANVVSLNGRYEVGVSGAQAYDNWLALSGG